MKPSVGRAASALVPFALLLAGLGAVAVLALGTTLSQGRTVVLLAWTFGGAAAAGVAAMGVLWLLRRGRLGLQMTVVAMAPVIAMAVGVAGGINAMFIASDEVRALSLIVVGAATIALATALVLAGRVVRASGSLGQIARRIGDEDRAQDTIPTSPKTAPGRLAVPEELAGLAVELERALDRLAESRARAESLEHSRRELVAWVSHDLRTPLTGIVALVEALEDNVAEDAETIARYHRTIRHEVERMSSLVDQLFALSRIQAGTLVLDVEPLCLEEIVDGAVSGVELAARNKGVDLRVEPGAQSLLVDVSAIEMTRVVANLLDNAIRHTGSGGRVIVGTRLDRDAHAAVLSVSDGCGGILAADLERVFEPAFRGDSARTPDDGRAGLGLAIARGLVEAQGGKITVRNDGEGCRFLVRLPLFSPVANSADGKDPTESPEALVASD